MNLESSLCGIGVENTFVEWTNWSMLMERLPARAEMTAVN